MQYELFYLVGISKDAELDKIKEEVKDLISSEGAKFEEKQVTEKRKLAYQVDHENYGFYVAQRFELEEPGKLQTINKKLNLYAKILRFLVTKTDDLPELTSRKERQEKNQSERAEIKEIKTDKKEETKKTSEKKEEKEEKITAKEDKEDIDKRLEEILNI